MSEQTQDDHLERAREIMAGHVADGLAALEENKTLRAYADKLEGRMALAEQRAQQLTADLGRVTQERDFFMRYATACATRLETIGGTVAQALEHSKDFARTFDQISRLATEQADRAHQTHLLLSSLVTTIAEARIDAKDSATKYKPPQIPAPAQGRQQQEDEDTRPLPSIVRKGPAIGSFDN